MVLPVRISRAVVLTNRSVSNTRLYGSASGEYNRASNPEKSDQAGDVLHQQFLAAKAVRRNPDKTTPLDAAAAQYRLLHKSSRRNLSGNPEGIGFAEQVGSQSATADRLQDSQAAVTHEGVAGEECITQSSLIDDMKNKLEMGVPIGGDQHNWGGGEGGKPRFDTAKRTLWTSAVKGKSAADHSTLGQVSDSNRKAKERVGAEQNLRTKHRFSAVTSDESKEGNIVADSVPPKLNGQESPKSPTLQRSRFFSTSALTRAEEKTKIKHTTDTYSKDVDNTPPPSSKTHQVDGSSTGAQVQRPNEEVTGFSKSGIGSKEYQTIDTEHPYDIPPGTGPESEEKMRYGGMPKLNESEKPKNTGEGVKGRK